jgi:hypothetical protein
MAEMRIVFAAPNAVDQATAAQLLGLSIEYLDERALRRLY